MPRGRKKTAKAVKIPEKTSEVETPVETPVVTPAMTTTQVDIAIKSDKQKMKEHLDAQPKVNFLIPLLPGEVEGSYETVCLNGYLMQIKKGALVSLPEQVVQILAEKYKVEMSAGSEKLVSRSSEVETALS